MVKTYGIGARVRTIDTMRKGRIVRPMDIYYTDNNTVQHVIWGVQYDGDNYVTSENQKDLKLI